MTYDYLTAILILLTVDADYDINLNRLYQSYGCDYSIPKDCSDFFDALFKAKFKLAVLDFTGNLDADL